MGEFFVFINDFLMDLIVPGDLNRRIRKAFCFLSSKPIFEDGRLSSLESDVALKISYFARYPPAAAENILTLHFQSECPVRGDAHAYGQGLLNHLQP